MRTEDAVVDAMTPGEWVDLHTLRVTAWGGRCDTPGAVLVTNVKRLVRSGQLESRGGLDSEDRRTYMVRLATDPNRGGV